MMEGALHDLSEQDTAVVEENVKAAYNDAFWAAGLSLDTFKALGLLGIQNTHNPLRVCCC